MNYNILKYSEWQFNTDEGNISVDIEREVLYNMIDYQSSILVELSGTDIMVIDFDFGQRIHTDRFEYKFDSDSNPYAIASGINFYYKNDISSEYISLNTYVATGDIFYTTISGGLFAPRYIRVKHDIANTYNDPTASGNVHGFRATNYDEVVNFGEDGQDTTKFLEVVRGGDYTTNRIPIYNNSSSNVATAYVNIEPKYSDVDEIMSISNSENGPWISVLDSDHLIDSMDDSNYFEKSNTEIIDNKLRLSVEKETSTGDYLISSDAIGYYISPIFSNNNNYCNLITNFIVDNELSYDLANPVNTKIEIRHSDTAPKPYGIIKDMTQYQGGSYNYYWYLRITDKWQDTFSTFKNSSAIKSCYRSSWLNYKVVVDNKTGNFVGFSYTNGYDGGTVWGAGYLILFNGTDNSSSVSHTVLSTGDRYSIFNSSFKYFRIDNTGGFWSYFYSNSVSASDFVNMTGYYLVYFDSSLSNTFKWVTSSELITSIDVNYDTGVLWYSRNDTGSLNKLTKLGVTEIMFIDEDVTYDLGAVKVFPDGSVMFANDKDLHRLSDVGGYLSEYLIEDVDDEKITCIALDGDGSEAIWVLSGNYVGRLFLTGDRRGEFDFRVDMGSPIEIQSIPTGVWTTCASESTEGDIVMKFLSKENRRVDIEYTPVITTSVPGVFYADYTHDEYSSKLSYLETIEDTWTDDIATYPLTALIWSEINPNNYLLSEDTYHQLKVSFSPQSPIERYPEFVTDPSKEYIYEDDFIQTSSTPNQLLWGNWSGKPATNRVYIDNNQLVLSATEANRIDTNNRVLYYRSNDLFDVEIKYKIGDGNGSISGLAEDLRVYVYSIGASETDVYQYARLYIDPDPISNTSYIQASKSTWGSYSYTFPAGTVNLYEGYLRLSVSYARTYWKENSGDSYVYTSAVQSLSSSALFYVYIYKTSGGSEVRIDDFNIINGNAYYFNDPTYLSSIYTQDLLEVNDIYPNNYKDIYLKTFVPASSTVASQQEIDMKVRWEVQD